MNSIYQSQTHRERGRGRKAFWAIVWAAIIVGAIYAFGTPW